MGKIKNQPEEAVFLRISLDIPYILCYTPNKKAISQGK
jgi:hypothetical protein